MAPITAWTNSFWRSGLAENRDRESFWACPRRVWIRDHSAHAEVVGLRRSLRLALKVTRDAGR